MHGCSWKIKSNVGDYWTLELSDRPATYLHTQIGTHAYTCTMSQVQSVVKAIEGVLFSLHRRQSACSLWELLGFCIIVLFWSQSRRSSGDWAAVATSCRYTRSTNRRPVSDVSDISLSFYRIKEVIKTKLSGKICLDVHQCDKNYLICQKPFFKGVDLLFSLVCVPSVKLEEAGFMTCTAASHQGVIEMFWLQFWEQSCHPSLNTVYRTNCERQRMLKFNSSVRSSFC